jgi:hypothetical protein
LIELIGHGLDCPWTEGTRPDDLSSAVNMAIKIQMEKIRNQKKGKGMEEGVKKF